MTDEELKKKIVEVVLNSEITGIQIRAITGGYSMANNIADALISAGIGDTTNLIVENKVLQRALLTTCVKLIEDEVDNVNAELLARVVYTKALRKAKKEVEEENNAEN